MPAPILLEQMEISDATLFLFQGTKNFHLFIVFAIKLLDMGFSNWRVAFHSLIDVMDGFMLAYTARHSEAGTLPMFKTIYLPRWINGWYNLWHALPLYTWSSRDWHHADTYTTTPVTSTYIHSMSISLFLFFLSLSPCEIYLPIRSLSLRLSLSLNLCRSLAQCLSLSLSLYFSISLSLSL